MFPISVNFYFCRLIDFVEIVLKKYSQKMMATQQAWAELERSKSVENMMLFSLFQRERLPRANLTIE